MRLTIQVLVISIFMSCEAFENSNEIPTTGPPQYVSIDLPNSSPTCYAQPPIAVIINKDNIFTVENTKVLEEELEKEILRAVDSADNDLIELYADKNSDYGSTTKVINIAKKNKLKVAIMTDN